MYKKLYDTLNKFVRRRNMAIYYFTGAMTMIPVGFALFLWGISSKTGFNKIFGAILIALAVILWIVSLIRAESERKQEREDRARDHRELIEAIGKINKGENGAG
jgi:hypothetical protein